MKYNPITLDEIKGLLKAEKGWKINDKLPGKEHIFEFPLTTRPYIVIRVYSTIRKVDDDCRHKGKDAIRVFAFNEKTGRGWIRTRKVLRVEGWRSNLTKAVTRVFNEARERK